MISARLSREDRLRKRSDFTRVFRNGKRIEGECVSLFLISLDSQKRKVGFVAGQGVGKATKRNRAKRIIREIIRKNREYIVPGTHLIVRARRQILQADYREIEREILRLLSSF